MNTKQDVQEFTKLVKELAVLNPTTCNMFKNQVKGAVETIKLHNMKEAN